MLKSIQHFAYIAALMAALALLASCTGGKKRYVIGVSQCSEDVWREKLNQELRVAALYYNNMDLDIASANDDVRLQTEQINRFVDKGVDLLIVAPGQVSISPAIDRAYEKGIPVIIFDRRTRSNKYTAYIGADNREIGASMGEYLAGALPKGGRVVELCGLSSSSPAIERAEGFDSVVAVRPSIDIVAKFHADWTEQGGFRAMDSLLRSPHPDFDCLFAHNDRMAMGARRAAQEHGLDLQRIRFCGIDAMPQKGAGLELVKDGTLFASYIYPTRGDEVMRLAMNILEGKSYQRENRLSSALVTRDNARVLLMQNDETMRQQDHLATLRSRIDKAADDFNTQRGYLLVLLFFVVLLVVACGLTVRAYVAKARINRQLNASMDQQRQMTEEMERMTQTQLQFFTNVSHELRTPLTLIAGPTDQLLEDDTVQGAHRTMLEMVRRNTRILIQLVGEILDFRKVQNNKAHLHLNRFALQRELVDDSYVPEDINAKEAANRITNAEDFDADRPLVLIIDDNNGMRAYLRSILKDRYNVSEAADGRQGLEKARHEVPKLIVCDVMMPVMDGLEFTRQLKEDIATSHIPVVLLTARSLPEQREKGYETGADSYLTKPFSGQVLLSRIDNLLRSRTLLRSLFSGDKAEAAEEERLCSQDKTFVTRLREIIQQHLADSDFSVERLGEEIGLSRVQLYRKVKVLTGKTPVELLRKARLMKARTMVTTTDRSIAEIAYATGFTSPSYFNKCFKDEFGVSPGGMRG